MFLVAGWLVLEHRLGYHHAQHCKYVPVIRVIQYQMIMRRHLIFLVTTVIGEYTWWW